MGRPRILDKRLLNKIAHKLGKKDIIHVGKLISKRASKLGISSEAALIIKAKELGIGVSSYQRTLDPAKQAEIRDALPSLFISGRKSTVQKRSIGSSKPAKLQISTREKLKATIEYLIQDKELYTRCEDILLAASNYDRPISQATLVLEDRIRKKSQPPKKMVGTDLVNYAINGDLAKTILKISDNPDEQKGYADIFRGIMLAFRNRTHHHIINSFSRIEALQICGFIDVLLHVVDKSTKIQ